jgi:hypothetical protein
VLAEGARLSLKPNDGETMPQFKARVQAAHDALAARPVARAQPSDEVIAARRASLALALKAQGRKP